MVDPPVLALVGPTGGGKSQLALMAADRLNAEIVAVDAFTVYRQMGVGTAKPTREERVRIPHHMIDVLDPSELCTVQWFQAEARRSIGDVLARGRVPLLVGGSGMYFRAVVDPLEFPPTDRRVRARLEAEHRAQPQAAHEALRAVDPDAAARMEPGNLRRAVRALEVIEITGRRFSDFRGAWDDYESIYAGLRVVGLGVPRPELDARIEARVESMLAAGLIEECRRLLAGASAADASEVLSETARQAIGYAEALDYLAGACSVKEVAERVKVRTRRYAARQVRWFARDPRVRWVTAPSALEALVAEGRQAVGEELHD